MVTGLFYFGANIVALTANVLTGAGLLISNPRSINARLFAGVTVSSACYLVGRISYAVPADVQGWRSTRGSRCAVALAWRPISGRSSKDSPAT
jgi:hypothetical protein